jgi:hypothetical protein
MFDTIIHMISFGTFYPHRITLSPSAWAVFVVGLTAGGVWRPFLLGDKCGYVCGHKVSVDPDQEQDIKEVHI